MMRIAYLVIIGVFLSLSSACVLADSKLQDMVASAKSGQTIQLPEGQFVGGVTLPAGVSLKGAGVGKTIIDATASINGLTIEGGSGATVSDLTVRGAKGAGMVVQSAESVTVSRVRVTGCTSGILVSKSKKARIENSIADHGSFGIVINGGSGCVVVNCNVVDCVEMGVSLAATTNAVIFNNCIAGSAICLNIDKPSSVQSDTNLFFGLYVGQMSDQSTKKVLTGWQYVTAEDNKPGLDLHSVQMPITFKDEAGGDFTPMTVLPWALDRTATADWGAAEFAGVKAPETDMAGKARVGKVDIGVLETSIQAPRTADGQFTVAKDEGLKSAGVFTKDGMLVSYLFQNLPLPAGKYSFWLPVRSYTGQPIAAGDYEVRLVESDFKWKYLSHIGDTGPDCGWGPMTASANPNFVAFASKDTVVMLEGWSEGHTALRCFDIKTGEIRWALPGSNESQGLVVKDGVIYFLYESRGCPGESRLTRVDAATGAILPWPGAPSGHVFPVTGPKSYSMTTLGDRLYVANAAGNKLVVLKIADGKIEKALNVASPKAVAGDDKNKVLWVISDGAIVALDAAGKQVAQSKLIEDPVDVAYCNGKLAVASSKTGKVHILDAANMADLKQVDQFGKGDGPYGKFEPDRFLFQKAPGWSARPDELAVSLALNADGQLAMTDGGHRVSMFDKDGKSLWFTYGLFGNMSRPSFSTGNRRLWDMWISTSFLMDEKAGTWQIEALWDFSAMSPKALKEPGIQPLGDFSVGGKTFVVAVASAYGAPNGMTTPMLMVGRIDGYKVVPVLSVYKEGEKIFSRKDTNKDGKIDAKDTAVPMAPPAKLAGAGKDAWGQQMQAFAFQRFDDLEADGSIIIENAPPYIWKCTGLDADGVPVYDTQNYEPLPNKDLAKNINPYDYQPEGLYGFVQTALLSDGGWVAQSYKRGSGGCGMNNGGGTDIEGFDRQGNRRWINQMAQYHGIAGMGTVDDITATAAYASMDVLVVDADGLSLGAFCETPKLHYTGYWIDHPNIRLFKMPDNHLYFTNGDNSSGRHPWYRLENRASMAKTKQPFAVSPKRAAELAAIKFQPATVPVCPQPQIKVAHLAKPMTIDGDLKKWRDADIRPQILIGPSGKMEGPNDLSALIRLAYEGNNLYVQVLSFDDVPVFGNFPVCQNSVEMAINGVWPDGMQFVAAKKYAGGEDVVWRNRFFDKNVAQGDLKHDHAPCIVKVLDNAQDVPEREALERLYGADMSKAKVIVTEFKIPMDKVTYKGTEKDVPQLGPGKTFWINFFVDDCDTPYTDTQELIAWPVGSGMFGNKEDGAKATCE